jgi:murein DD-endopeptidase MepM/ murein hydrolase activator NlpD
VFGKIVYIKHENGFETRYAHLDSIDVKYKQEIDKGDIIGKVGNTGKSKGVHLHYEIRKNDQPMDPVKFWLLYY